jgi:hypothetical protein
MVDRNPRKNPEETAGGNATAGAGAGNATSIDCLEWEALLADKMDGAMAPEAEAAFAEHGHRCPGCSELLEQARQGQQWLKLLEENAPAAPVDLLSRILAKTQGAGHETDFPIGGAGTAVLPGQGGRWGIPFLPPPSMPAAHGAQNARLLMTAGMAVFSVALTLSVAGVHLTSVHAAELRPGVVQASVSRSFYGTKKQVVSFYENLRVVYEVESKMREMRHDTEPTPAPAQTPAGPGATKPHASSPGHAEMGGSLRNDALDRHEAGSAKRRQPVERETRGWPFLVTYRQRSALSVCHRVALRLAPGSVRPASTSMPGGVTGKERNRI